MTIHQIGVDAPEEKDNSALEGALAAAALGLEVFPLRADTKDGFLMPGSWKSYTTSDPHCIREMASKFPGCNWGIWCVGHVVLDADVADGKPGLDTLAMLEIQHDLPRTRAQRSARGGRHEIYKLPPGVEVSNRDSRLGPGVNVRGAGGYIICVGSTFGGMPYTLATDAPIADAPASLIRELTASANIEHPEPLTTFDGCLTNRQALAIERWARKATHAEAEALASVPPGDQRNAALSASVKLMSLVKTVEHYGARCAEDIGIEAELAFIEAVTCMQPSREPWTQREAQDLWQSASAKASPRDIGEQLSAWESVDFDDVSELAAEIDTEAAEAAGGEVPPVDKGELLCWPAVNDNGQPYPKNIKNIKAVLLHLGVTLTRDAFAGQNRIKGFGFDGQLDDDALRALHIKAFTLGLACPKEHFLDVLFELARQNETHPVREYLDALEWDGTPRVESWLVNYLRADDTPLNRAFGSLWLTALVRRVRQPGCKFDAMLVLEGGQGIGKSTVFRIIGGEKWTEDSLQLSADPKQIIENTRGKWVCEIAELSGMGQRDVEHIKAAITRRDDTARLSYARVAVTVPRQFVLAATTNDTQYLRDTTGNRRFWPVAVGEVDLEGLKRDRDQLLAEAAAIEAKGGSLALPVELRAVAGEVQAEREAPDPYFELLQDNLDGVEGYLTSEDAWGIVKFTDRPPTPPERKRIAVFLKKLGWTPVAGGQRRRINGHLRSGYIKWQGSISAAPIVTTGSRAQQLSVFDARYTIDDLLA